MSKIVMLDDLIEQMSNFKSQKDVAKFIKKYRALDSLPMIMMNYADELRTQRKIRLEILSQKKDICKYALIESALAIPSKVTHAMIKPAFGNCYG